MLKLQIPVNSKGDVFEFNLAKEKVTIGRRHDNDIRIKETYVSAYHAELSQAKDGRIFLSDRDSSNGTFLNGKRVRERVQVSKGDILKFGSLKCSIEEVMDKLRDGSTISVSDASLAGISNKTSAVSARGSNGADHSDNQQTTAVSLKSDTSPQVRERHSSPVIGDTYTTSAPRFNDDFDSATESLMPSGIVDAKPDFSELESLRSQLSRKKDELRKAREELEVISRELSKTKESAAKDGELKLQKIADLEKRLKKNKADNGKLSQRLQLATDRAEELATELEHHKTDMSVEIKAAMQRLTHTKNDNVLLQSTMDALENERNKYRDQSLEISRKLEKTREGFSQLLQSSGQRLGAEQERAAELDGKCQESETELSKLEQELDDLRKAFRKMEAEYGGKLENAAKIQQQSYKKEKSLKKDLELAHEEMRTQKAELVKLESTLEAIVAEKEAAEEDWSSRVVELRTTNQKLVDNSGELELLEKRLKDSREEVEKLRSERDYLVDKTDELREEKKILSAATKKISGEKDRSSSAITKLKDESLRASRKLDEILHNLRESEKKVSYLRNLENELEKSVLRAQRSALSRKGIYREDEEEYTTIWPETEQLICRELIDRLELLEDLLNRYRQNWFFPKVAEQLNLLRDSFMALLKNHSVDQFDLEPGTELSVESRKKIQLISVDDVEDPKLKRLSNSAKQDGSRTRVVQTLRPGYIYSKGGQDVIIRKAEVIVS